MPELKKSGVTQVIKINILLFVYKIQSKSQLKSYFKMNRQLALSAKKYNFLEKLEINTYVDAIDQNKWKIAKIIGFKNVGHRHTIRLHFDGYLSSWDQDFDLPASNKLAPFRRFTLPYTGPGEDKKAIHRPVPSLNFQAPLNDLRKLTKAEKQKIKPEFIIQTFRGQLFILVDTFLTQSVKLRLEQLIAVTKFLQAYIETGIHILKYAIQKFPEISKQYVSDPNVIYVNSTYALISSITQILFNFNSLVSPKQRRVKFYLFGQGSPEQARKKMKDFLKSKGIIQICHNILNSATPPARGFPWSIKKEVLVFLAGMEQLIQFPKVTDSRQISEALDILGYLKMKQAFSDQIVENIHIQLVLSLVLSGNFQGKLKGLAELKRMCEGTLYVRRQVLKQKILSQNLLNALTDNATFNSEVFKRSIPVFEAAAKFDLLTQDILKRIINLHKDKHELQLKSYYTTLAQFGPILQQKKVLQLFEQIKKFEVDIDSIDLVKDFTRNVIVEHPLYKKLYMNSQENGFGLVYLWQIINKQTSQQIVTHAISAFSALAGDLFYRQVIQKYLVQCFSNIKAAKNIEKSLKIIHSCLNKNRELVSLVENIDKQFSIIDTLVKSLIQEQSIDSKTIQSIFEFIEEVNQHARKKITVDHIKDLWNLKQCHKNLLKFMRKYTLSKQQKSQQKIILKKLSPAQIRQIFIKIFLNKALMNNYTVCDEQLYKTIDELLISYNHRNKFIDYNYKHCIRCISPQEIFGIQIYLDISMGCKDQVMANRALRRYVQYFTRPNKSKLYSCKVDKVGLWLYCAEKINKYMEQSPKKYVGFSLLFEQIQGRMKSINILDPSEASFTVLAKQSNTRKIISIQRCSSLWRLRQVIDTQFKLNKTNFQIYVTQKRSATDMQTQQDFSVAYLQPPKDPTQIAVVITQSKQTHPHYVCIESFKNQFSSIYAEKIYESLSGIKNSQIQLVALKLLMYLPLIKSLELKITKLQIGKQITWEQILDVQCKPKLRYQIHVLNKVKSQGIPWISNFIKKGGVQHIQKILRLRASDKSALSIKDYEVLNILLQFFNQTIQFYRIQQPHLPFNQSAVIEIMRFSYKQKSSPHLLQDPTFIGYFYLTFIGLKEMVTHYSIDGFKILSSPFVLQVLEFLLFTDKKLDIQSRFPQILLKIGQKSKSQKLFSEQCEIFLTNCQKNPQLKYSCRVFFDFLVHLFDNNFVTDQLFNKTLIFIQEIRNAPFQVYAQKQNATNELIKGWLRICKCLLFKSITDNLKLKFISQSQQSFADFLIKDGLFGQNHRFESEKTRVQAFEILSQLSCKKQVVDNIDKLIKPIITKGPWRKQYQWFVKSFRKRSKNSQIGLKNLAATCYINSLLQQLYHIKQFSQALLQIDTTVIDTQQNIAFQIQKIFAYLQYSNRDICTTQSLCQTFISEGQPIDPRIQMDIDQFFHTLMDKLEQNLMKIKKQNIIDDVFKGEYSNLIVGQECQHKSQRIQEFLSMRLQIIKKSSLTQALTQFIKGEVLQGQNAYSCQKCDKKVKAVKRVCVKSLPDVLILTLKRFQFDFDRMEKFKLNSFCEFDQQLDMQPYTRQFLYQNEEKLPSQQYKYKLKGVVIHYGVSEAGHYTSYIRTENGEWKYFDDEKISNFNIKDLGNQCFGGPDDNPYSQNTQKLKNAYLLIYERIKKQVNNQLKITNSNIKSLVDAQNLNNQQIKVIFDQGLQAFFDSYAIHLGKTYILFVHLVSLRSQKRSQVYKKCYENCIAIFQSNPQIVQWYLQQFNDNLIKELLIFTISQVSNFVASLLVYCVARNFNGEFIKRCMKCIEKKNMMGLCKVFQAAALVPAYGKILNQYSFGQKIYKIIKEDKAPNQGSLTKLQPKRSQFGESSLDFYDKKDTRNSIELICCIQLFKFKNFPQEEVQPLTRRAKKFSTQVALAKFFALKFKDDEQLGFLVNGFLFPFLTKLQPKIQQEYLFRFAIILMGKLCEVKDENTKRRVAVVVQLYLIAIKESLQGYKAMRYLILGLFSLCFNNQVVREQFINQINSKDNKKFIKFIRDWMKQAQRFSLHVKTEKMGYWRRVGRSPYNAYQKVQNDPKITSQKYLSLFNSLLQKHKVQFPDLWSTEIKKGQLITLTQFSPDIYEVVDKFGLILQIKSVQGSQRFILEDDVFPIRSI